MSRGTIDKRISERTGKVSWVARWSFVDGKGKRAQREKAFDTKREASDFLTKTHHELRSKTYVEASREPLGVYLASWVDSLSRTSRKSSTVYAYRQLLSSGKYEAIAHIPLADLRIAHVEEAERQWSEAGYAAHTVTTFVRTLRVALNDAIRLGKITANPTKGVQQTKKAERFRPKTWSGDEVKTFFALTDGHRDGLMWRFTFLTLVREGELAALVWSDVDLDGATVRIARTLRRNEFGVWGVGDSPKSTTSKRTIQLPKSLVDRIKLHRQEQQERFAELGIMWSGASPLFDRGDGTMHSCASVLTRFRSAVKRHKMKEIRFHDARHSGATLLINNGVPIKTVSEILGHSDPGFTLRLYVHPGGDDQLVAVESLNALYGAIKPQENEPDKT